MMGYSHCIIGILSTSLALQTADPVLLGLGAIAALFPDIDSSKSTVGRILSPISTAMERHWSHRGFTHSIACSLAIALATYPLTIMGWVPVAYIHAVNIGFASGYISDVFTPAGVCLFFPSRSKWVLPKSRKYRIITGSDAERGLLVALIVITLAVLYINVNAGGFGKTFSNFLAQPSGVVELLNASGADHQILAEVKGVRAIDRQPVAGQFEIIEVSGLGFIVKDKTGAIYKAGTEADSQLLTEKITGKVGAKATTLLKQLNLNDEEISPAIRAFTATLSQNASVYLSGTLSVEDIEDLTIATIPGHYPTIQKSGGSVTLSACPVDVALKVLGDAWGSGTLIARIIYNHA